MRGVEGKESPMDHCHLLQLLTTVVSRRCCSQGGGCGPCLHPVSSSHQGLGKAHSEVSALHLEGAQQSSEVLWCKDLVL